MYAGNPSHIPRYGVQIFEIKIRSIKYTCTNDHNIVLMQKIKENIIRQARYYLENMGEFYPFGAIIDRQNNIKPLGVYFGEENPTSQLVIAHLEKAITERVNNGEYITGAIGIDVFITNSEREKMTALEIREFSKEKTSVSHFIYTKDQNKYLFDEYNEQL